MGGKKASSPRKQKPAFVSAEPLEERGSSELGVFSTCTCSLLVAVLVGVLAVFVASNNAVGGLEEGCVDSTSGYAIPEVFGHLYTINKVPYHQLLVGDNFNYADGSSVPALPDNAFKNPHDIIPALAKAISDHNVVVSVQLVELLLDEKKVSPATATIATSKQVGYGFGQAGLHVNPNAKTTVTAKSSSAYARLLWKASEPFYFETNEQLVNLRVVLLHKFFDITFDSRSQSSNSDKRRAVDMLGLALESRNLSGDQNKMGDIDAAWKLYNGAVALGLWGLPDQRPQHYFPFLEPGDPFPSADLYRGAVDLLESNWSTIRRDLIQHRKFPGKMDIDREHLACGGGRWLQADFLFHNKFDGDNSAKFPQTADILKQIYEEYARDLPDAIMQMSTMTKGTKVRPHCGSGNHKVRLHLALHIPEGVGIKIANETDCWVNGKVLPVDDSYVHSVWNDSNEPRTVLIVDVWKAGMTSEDKDKVMRYFANRDRGTAASKAPLQGVAFGSI